MAFSGYEPNPLKTVLDSVQQPVSLLNMDIEGSEFEVVESTSVEQWKRISAIAVEVHDDASLARQRNHLLHRFEELGYTIEPDHFDTYFLHRNHTAMA